MYKRRMTTVREHKKYTAYRLLANPNITDEAAEQQVEGMLCGCSEAAKERRHE
jgi:hypothetical protein